MNKSYRMLRGPSICKIIFKYVDIVLIKYVSAAKIFWIKYKNVAFCLPNKR